MSGPEPEAGMLPGDERLRRKFGTVDVPVTAYLPEDMARSIAALDFFFIATSNRAGECDSSYRGKRKGVPAIRVLDERTLIFPDYLGNGSFRSLGNILENPHIGMLFIDPKTGLRMRVNGDAAVCDDADWLELFPGSLQTVRVVVREIYKQNRPVKRGRQAVTV